MYDMKPMAESLASQGRYGDSMLVHMNPVEVAGLRAAAQKMGGDLTTNPRTGQPEAFLPFLIGMGLQGLGMSALGAGIATGLGTAAITKDLGQGIMAGLGAYGGAGIGEGLGAAGGVSATPTVAPELGAGITTTPSPTSLDMSLAGDVTTGGVGTGISTTPPTTGFQANLPQLQPESAMFNNRVPIETVNNLNLTAPVDTVMAEVPKTGQIVTPELTGLGSTAQSGSSLTGLQNVMSTGPTGEAARQAFMQNVGGGSGLLTKTAYGIAPYALEKALEQPEFNAPKDNSLIRPYDYDPTTRRFTVREPYRAPGPEYMAQGGLAGLTGYKEGNILRGQGDGMSDEIKASIDGEQDVLLSDGEYVVPADAVAMLGNGSTDAGADRLDAMIARLRTQKYGRNKQPPEMKAESVMPA